MKKLILLLGLSITLVGCSNDIISDKVVYDYNSKSLSTNQTGENTTVVTTNDTRFVKTGNVYSIYGDNWQEVVDTLTGNLYIGRSSIYQAGFSPLYDENGEIMNINNK